VVFGFSQRGIAVSTGIYEQGIHIAKKRHLSLTGLALGLPQKGQLQKPAQNLR
jgi:hypothetical protein